MPEPREYRVVLALRDALAAIAVTSGHFYTVASTAIRLDPNSDVEALVAPEGPRPFVLLQVFPERWRYDPHGQLELVLPATIHWIHEADPAIATDRLRVYWRGCADVERAITADGWNVELSGLAREIRIVERTLRDELGDGAIVWAALRTEVTIDREYGKPNG